MPDREASRAPLRSRSVSREPSTCAQVRPAHARGRLSTFGAGCRGRRQICSTGAGFHRSPAARGRPGPGPARTGSHPHQLRAGRTITGWMRLGRVRLRGYARADVRRSAVTRPGRCQRQFGLVVRRRDVYVEVGIVEPSQKVLTASRSSAASRLCERDYDRVERRAIGLLDPHGSQSARPVPIGRSGAAASCFGWAWLLVGRARRCGRGHRGRCPATRSVGMPGWRSEFAGAGRT